MIWVTLQQPVTFAKHCQFSSRIENIFLDDFYVLQGRLLTFGIDKKVSLLI